MFYKVDKRQTALIEKLLKPRNNGIIIMHWFNNIFLVTTSFVLSSDMISLMSDLCEFISVKDGLFEK